MTLEKKLKKLTALERKALEEQLDQMVSRNTLEVQEALGCAQILHTILCSKDHSGDKLECNFYKKDIENKNSDFVAYLDKVETIMNLLAYTNLDAFQKDLSAVTTDLLKVEAYPEDSQGRLFIMVFLMKYLKGEAVLSQVSDALSEIAVSQLQSSSSSEHQENENSPV